jgi:hypothetical protein
MRDPGHGFTAEDHDPSRIAPEIGIGVVIAGLPAYRSVDTDKDQRSSAHDQNQVNVCNLFVGIEDGDQQETGEGASEGDNRDLGTDDCSSSRALVRIGQMPLASGTGGH